MLILVTGLVDLINLGYNLLFKTLCTSYVWEYRIVCIYELGNREHILYIMHPSQEGLGAAAHSQIHSYFGSETRVCTK